ncbi:MAG: hypothetical protein HRT88_01210 [Lentisphaeraceae bacterium]|nr:hypothetical protein [Lentisphaeraceae bacterium]
MTKNENLIRNSLIAGAEISLNDFSFLDLKILWDSEFCYAPLSGRYLTWVISSELYSQKDDLVCYLLERCKDPGAFATLALMLSQGHLSNSHFNDLYISKLLQIINDVERYHGLRGQALLVCAMISIENTSSFRQLRSHFFSEFLSDDGRYLKYLAAAMGMLASHITIHEVEEHLTLLKNIPEASEEASFQLGVYYLAKGLESSESTGAINCFERAKNELSISARQGDGRPDAKILFYSVKLLLNFHEGVLTSQKNQLDEFSDLVFEYSALLIDGHNNLPLMGNRANEAFQWMVFTSKLSLLEESLNEEIWLEAIKVIEEQLFFIYSAQRSLFKNSNRNGIATVVQPIISARIQESRFQILATKKYLEDIDVLDRGEDWRFFYEELSQQLNSSIHRNIVDMEHSNFSKVIPENIAVDKTYDIEWLNNTFKESALIFREQSTSPAVAILHERLVNFLSRCNENDDIHSHKNSQILFMHLVEQVINFLVARIHTPSSKVSGVRYLHADFNEPVKEAHLQDDLYSFLQNSPFSENIMYEPQKIAGGRADIFVNYQGVKTVIELKKIDTKMTDDEVLERYVPQAATYQVADTNFCFLGVLDNYESEGVQVDLRESFSCHHWSPVDRKTRYSIILFRVQAKRKSPSTLSKRPKSIILGEYT